MANSFAQPWYADGTNDYNRKQYSRLLPRRVVPITNDNENDDSDSDFPEEEEEEEEEQSSDDGDGDLPPEDHRYGQITTLVDHREHLLNQTTRVRYSSSSTKPQYAYDEWSTYVLDHREQMTTMLKDLFVDIRVDRWVNICFETWTQVHQSPMRYSGYVKYRWLYHVLVVLHEMSDPIGLRVPIFEVDDYGTSAMYEQEPLEWIQAIRHEPLVKEHYPNKKDLQRIFSKSIVVESTDQRVVTTTTAHKKKSSSILVWSNKEYNSSVQVLRQCLTDYHRILYHHHDG